MIFPFLQLFGRSKQIERLGDAFRIAGVHPRLVPDAVLMTVLRLLKTSGRDDGPEACAEAADFVAYLMLGGAAFSEARGPDHVARVEARLEAALEAGDGLDAELVLLALHAGLIHARVLKAYQIDAS